MNKKEQEKAEEELRKVLEEDKKETIKRQNGLVGKFYLAKILDILSVIILIATVIIVVYLFTVSLFEGFISLVAGFFFLRYIFKKRSSDFLSKFLGWF